MIYIYNNYAIVEAFSKTLEMSQCKSRDNDSAQIDQVIQLGSPFLSFLDYWFSPSDASHWPGHMQAHPLNVNFHVISMPF